jgi:hypothetical protein
MLRVGELFNVVVRSAFASFPAAPLLAVQFVDVIL